MALTNCNMPYMDHQLFFASNVCLSGTTEKNLLVGETVQQSRHPPLVSLDKMNVFVRQDERNNVLCFCKKYVRH